MMQAWIPLVLVLAACGGKAPPEPAPEAAAAAEAEVLSVDERVARAAALLTTKKEADAQAALDDLQPLLVAEPIRHSLQHGLAFNSVTVCMHEVLPARQRLSPAWARRGSTWARSLSRVGSIDAPSSTTGRDFRTRLGWVSWSWERSAFFERWTGTMRQSERRSPPWRRMPTTSMSTTTSVSSTSIRANPIWRSSSIRRR